MSEYTPTTERVRDTWTNAMSEGCASGEEPVDAQWDTERRDAQFDRWLAAHDAEVRAEALHDAYWAVHGHRFDHTNGIRPMNSLYAGVAAAKVAITDLHGNQIVGPWVPVKQEGDPS